MASTVTSKNKIITFTWALALSSTAAIAQDVELSARDGSLSLRGQLIEFVDQKYTIETSIGRMAVDSNKVRCRGEACPVIDLPISEFSIVGLGMRASKIMQELLPAYAQSIGAQINNTTDEGYVLTNAEDETIATISLSNALLSNSLPDLLSEQAAIEQAAIVLSTKPWLPEEALEVNLDQQTDQSVDYNPADNSQVMGLNAITIITAKDNPISAISVIDVARVFSGEYRNWSELGGPDAPITLYGPQPDSELAKSFEAQILSTQDDGKSQLSQDIFFFENIAERVATNPNGIGYTYFSTSQPAKALDILGVCGMATPANSFTIKAEEYPLTQRLYAYRLGQANSEHADALVSFMQSDAGQDVISSNSLVNQRDTGNSIKNQGTRFVSAIAANATVAESELLRAMVTQIIGSERLSTTFRFETGSDQMDQRAQADIVRLAEKLQSPGSGSSVVHLIGFTDSVGDFDLNQEVSLRRASQVRDALVEIDAALAKRVSILPAGYGEIAPVACNETAQGRSINRRVEVWMDEG